jgi:signal transduction histidine kinase
MKVLIYFVLTAAAIVSAFGFFTYLMITQDLNREMESRLFMAGKLIKESINTGDLKYLELKGKIYSDYLKKFAGLRDTAGINNVIIINKDKKVLLSLAPEGGDFYLNLDSFEINKALKGETISSPLYRGAMDRYYKTGYVPITQGNSTEAVLAVEASVLYMQYINHYRVSLAAAGLIILVLAFGVSFFITSGITRSIRRLQAKAEAIARREFGKGIKVGGEEEIRVLAYTLESMEKELQSYIEDREKMASVGEFSAGVAHEIRNSLASLSGYAELIREKTKDEKIKKYATDITQNAMKMSGFLNNFLDYTKEFKPEMHETEIGSIIEETISELPAEARESVNFISAPGGIDTNADVYLIKKALYNIIINAYQACDKKEKLITVTLLKVKAVGKDRVQIIVKDNGKGMSADTKAKIFHPFFTGRKEGTGLGLAISYRIIKEIHKGEISIISEEGKGTEVIITL